MRRFSSIYPSLLLQVLFATVYSAITYFMTDQPPELERFLKFVLVYILTAVMADAFGTFLGTLITPVVSILNFTLVLVQPNDSFLLQEPSIWFITI